MRYSDAVLMIAAYADAEKTCVYASKKQSLEFANSGTRETGENWAFVKIVSPDL
ncbi:hypothetical protein ACFOLL_07105 [Falsochrobactrum ovis]|uniref:hypothetical protein n=1 Tax=Falsochrobactrum ovis TaxID=1293442 RepID=UPI00360B949E